MQLGLSGEPPAGILLIDKPTGITSHDVIYQVRKKTGVKRVGHAGTLDPLATGLLVVLVGREFTKRQAEFLKQDKTYEVTAQLGVTTDTYDADGQIVKQTEVKDIDHEKIKQALNKFKGSILQTVPAYSAVKVGGKKLYEQARKGQLVELPVREVEVKKLEIISLVGDELQLVVACSSGTYIRSLIHDLGQALGVGAHVTQLRRTHIGQLSIDQAIRLEDL